MRKKLIHPLVISVFFIILVYIFTQSQLLQTHRVKSVHFTEYSPITNIVLDFMKSSKSFLYVSALDVSHPTIISYLKELNKNGIDVRILSEKPVTNLPCKIDTSRGLHHVKFMVNDFGVLFGSANFSFSGLESGLNDIIIFPSNYVPMFKEFFLNAWEYGKIGKVHGFYVSPIDSTEEMVLSLVQSARKRIWVCVYAFTDSNLMASLKFKESQKIDVKIITDKWFRSSPAYKYYKDRVKIITNRMLHHKFMIVDNTLITGSTNFTESGFHKNVEMIWKTTDSRIVKIYEKMFSDLFYGSW
ncbi:phospholipase D-like domain-containing protein [Fervidobacterium sp.]